MDEREYYRHLGKRIASRRAGLSATQEEFSRAIGLSRASLANIERGEQRVYVHQITKIASALGEADISSLIPANDIETKHADITLSGDNVTSAQRRAIRGLVNSVYNSSKRGKKP